MSGDIRASRTLDLSPVCHHDNVCAPLLPDHPPELAEGLGQRALSGDVSVLLPVAVDVVCVDVVAAWNTCQTQQNTQRMRNWVFSMLLFGCLSILLAQC